jgi:hypothetical protein
MERRRREWDEHVTRKDAERLSKTQGTIYLLEEGLQTSEKKYGVT